MFTGREKELKALARLYESGKFEFAVIYGRRRVGKTALINQFIGDKEAIYFTGVESNAAQNLLNLSGAIMEHALGISGGSFESFQAALEYVFKLARTRRLIFVIDEYPYAARAEAALASTLQMLIDKYKADSKLMLILCGSSVSYMEDEVLAYKAPLYGRRTAQIRLLPFDFSETCAYCKGFSNEDKALVYGIVGGTPQYLSLLDDRLTIGENIRALFLNPASALFDEPISLLRQEIREPAIYNAIISAIASGCTRMSEIAAKAGESTSSCSVYLKSLINLGLIRKEFPYGEETSKKAIYKIEDNMFRFWYRFVPDNIAAISRGAGDVVLKRMLEQLSHHMGSVFEDICAEYMWRLLAKGQLQPEFGSLGRWWGNDPALKQQTEIDLMAARDNKAIFCECKWTNEKADKSVLETLDHRAHLFNYGENTLFVFSKAGFTEGCRQEAERLGNVRLIDYNDILTELCD